MALDPFEWSWDVLSTVARAEQAGLTLTPHGAPDFGWDLSQGSRVIIGGALLPAIKEELDKRTRTGDE